MSTQSPTYRFLFLLVALVLSVAGVVVCSASPTAKTFTLVIDAGHGGKDAGAVGAVTKEKNINLNVALAFGRMVERNCPDVKVVYTRKTDVFVSLQERANIANKAKADLFISIHTNAVATNKGSVSGAETYTLGMHRAAENLEVAKRENSVISYESNYKTLYQGFDPNKTESYIIFELMQDRYMSESIKLAKAIQQQYGTEGRRNKGVHQAGFLVLRETSMPSVLTELGFISNPTEEKYLNSQSGVNTLASCLYRGLQNYRRRRTADATTNTVPTAERPMLADNNLPPIYTPPGGEPGIQPVAFTPYNDIAEQPQGTRTTQVAEPVSERSAVNGNPAEQPASQRGEKLPPPASTLNLPPEKEMPQPEQVKEPLIVTVEESPQENVPPKTPETDPRTGQKLPPLASTLNLPPEKEEVGIRIAENTQKNTNPDAGIDRQTAELPEKTPIVEQQKPKILPQKTEKSQQNPQETRQKSSTTQEKATTTAQPPKESVQPATENAAADRLLPVFKIQILTSNRPLRNNDARLKGLNAGCYQENGIYKYTYGETGDYQEILRLKKTLAGRFPDTFIIAFVDGKRTNLSEAIKQSKKK